MRVGQRWADEMHMEYPGRGGARASLQQEAEHD